jgi:hypothetical protein
VYIYIMGRGHSGSTVLDAMLGNAPGIESVGELVSGMGRYEAPCSCGAAMKDCEFWSAVRSNFERNSGASWEEAARLSTEHAHIKNWLVTRIYSENRYTRLSEVTRSLHNAISEVSGKEHVLDSSKEVTRGLFLLRFYRDAKVIHLVRHPEGVMASHYARLRKGHPFKFLRRKYRARWLLPFLAFSSVLWLVGNSFAELSSIGYRRKVMRLRYEDLCANLPEALGRLDSFLEVDLTTLIRDLDRGDELEIGHNIGGNHMRMGGRFRFDPRKGTSYTLPRRYKLVCRVVCWPLMLRYGYR